METLFLFLKAVPVVIAAAILGHWFLAEVKKARKSAAPWYSPYISAPGILIVLAILIPILMRILND